MIVFSDSASDAADLARLAESFRMTSFGPDSEARFRQALGKALGAAGPSLIAVRP